MKCSTDRILTTHVGSLPRRPDLARLLRRRDRGESADGIDARIAQGVAEIVRCQRDIGITVVNDGEASKYTFATYVKERLDGFGPGKPYVRRPSPEMLQFPKHMQKVLSEDDFEAPACVAPVRSRGVAAVETDIANLTAALSGAGLDADDAFMTAASPGVIAFFLRNEHYASYEEYVWALAEAMKPEYDAIHAAGLVLQIDCPDLAMARSWLPEFGADGARANLEALDHATRDIPSDRMRMHLCWGNYEGPHNHDIPLREIIEPVLQARPAGLVFEAANPRHEHEWRVFEEVRVPDDKVLIPGVIDTTTNYIEHPQLVADRIERFAGIVGRERVIAGTDCGLATVAGSPMIDFTIAFTKLEALCDGAAIASRSLFG